MLALTCGAIWAGLVVYLLSRAARQFRAFRKTALLTSSDAVDFPAVSIIVPVRNEIGNIAKCLTGLTAQTYLSGRSSIIMVDDDSQDGTVAAIENHIALD